VFAALPRQRNLEKNDIFSCVVSFKVRGAGQLLREIRYIRI
jgi:hypothetical protein